MRLRPADDAAGSSAAEYTADSLGDLASALAALLGLTAPRGAGEAGLCPAIL